MTIHKDCFAYRIGHCAVMTEMICRHSSCSFYKTKEQDKKDRERYAHNKYVKAKDNS